MVQPAPPDEVIQVEVQEELKRRNEEIFNWENLKRACRKALREAGYPSNITGKYERRRIPWAVLCQHTDRISGKKYGKWMDKHGVTDEEGNVIESPRANPDVLSESDGHTAYMQRVNRMYGATALAAKVVRDLRSTLSPRQYDVYVLHVDQGLSLRLVGERLGLSHDTVKEHWEKLQVRLRRVLTGDISYPPKAA